MKTESLYMVYQREESPTCGNDWCDARENPEHWVDVAFSLDFIATLKNAAELVALACEGQDVENECWNVLRDLRDAIRKAEEQGS